MATRRRKDFTLPLIRVWYLDRGNVSYKASHYKISMTSLYLPHSYEIGFHSNSNHELAKIHLSKATTTLTTATQLKDKSLTKDFLKTTLEIEIY